MDSALHRYKVQTRPFDETYNACDDCLYIANVFLELVFWIYNFRMHHTIREILLISTKIKEYKIR